MIRISGSEWLGRVVFLGALCVGDALVVVAAMAFTMALAVVRCSWRDAIALAVAGRETGENP